MKSLVVCLVGLLVSVHASPVSPPVLSGQVRLADGSPVADARVVLFDSADLAKGPVGQAITDEAGQFALPLAASAAQVLPQGFALGLNYPNPFNPSTIIPYQLAAPSPVRLEVFNILGQHMATLVDGEQAAGSYRARWDGTDAAGGAAASGVYFYRLTVAGAHQTGRMVLVDGQVGVPTGGPRVAAVPLAAGSTGTYGLVVSGDGLVAYVDAAFGVEAGQGPVDLVVEAEPPGRGKAVMPTLAGMLGDVDNNGRVDMDDGLLVAMHRVDPSLSLPNYGQIGLGDVDCNGRVERTDAALIATFVANPSASAVSSLRIGQRGGYSLNPVTEMVWASILGTEQQDATVARLLDEVPVLIAGVFDIDGRDHLYLGIDRDYYNRHGGEHIYNTLKERFPITPLFVEASDGIQREPVPGSPSAKRATDEPEEASEKASNEDGGLNDLFSLFDALDDETEGPDLAVTRTTASPASVQPGDTLTVRAHVTNLGTVDAPSANVHVYRHTATTTDPRRIGTREPNATVTGTLLAPSASVTVTVQTTAPAVSAITTYYYYVCVDAVEEEQVHNNCSGTPAIVTVQSDSATPDEVVTATPDDEPTETPDDEPTETPDDEPTETPNLTISSLFISPDRPESGTAVTVRVTVENDGTASAGSETIRLYRHTSRTSNPTSGVRLATTATTGSLAPGAQVTRTIIATVPSVTTDTTYYYYACVTTADDEVNTDDNCTGPAEIRVLDSIYPPRPAPPYNECYSGPQQKAPLGGDSIFVRHIAEQYIGNCGTITLGGLETIDGARGFIVSGHVVAEDDISSETTDIFLGYGIDENADIKNLLGKVLKMPSRRTEGGKSILSVDAAFAKYPNPYTLGCSLTWQKGDESFCLDDTDKDDYIDRISPLTIRGREGDIYKVIGSKRPTKGLKVTFTGASSGPSKKTFTVHERILVMVEEGHSYFYAAAPYASIPGDSGSPFYTIPDTNGNVHIVGIISGSFATDSLGAIAVFSPWYGVTEEFNLKPISP